MGIPFKRLLRPDGNRFLFSTDFITVRTVASARLSLLITTVRLVVMLLTSSTVKKTWPTPTIEKKKDNVEEETHFFSLPDECLGKRHRRTGLSDRTMAPAPCCTAFSISLYEVRRGRGRGQRQGQGGDSRSAKVLAGRPGMTRPCENDAWFSTLCYLLPRVAGGVCVGGVSSQTAMPSGSKITSLLATGRRAVRAVSISMIVVFISTRAYPVQQYYTSLSFASNKLSSDHLSQRNDIIQSDNIAW